jgi:hypothetical protein
MYIDPNTGGVLAGILLSIFGVASGLVLVFAGKIRKGIATLRRKVRKDKDEDVQ